MRTGGGKYDGPENENDVLEGILTQITDIEIPHAIDSDSVPIASISGENQEPSEPLIIGEFTVIFEISIYLDDFDKSIF